MNRHTEADSPAVYEESLDKYDKRHSALGIASFVIAILTVIGYLISFGTVGLRAASILNDNNNATGSAESIMLLGLSVLILVAVNIVGGVIGILGLTRRHTRKIFAAIGTIVNGVILLLFMLLIASILVNAGAA